MRSHGRFAVALAGSVAALALTACSGTSAPAARTSSGSAEGGGQLTVFAAASLTEAFTTLGQQFEAAHPGVRVRFSFGPSSGLAQQITQGAPADVFASASPASMAQVTAAGDAGAPQTFATNVMEVAVPPDNPARVGSLADLARPGVKVALCQPQVPCGAVAAKVLTGASVRLTPVSQEADVKAVLTKVQLGEVDAGLVYATDVRAAGAKVLGVAIPDAVNASTSYPIATLTSSRQRASAQAFVDFVLSAAGRGVLTAAGFRQP